MYQIFRTSAFKKDYKKLSSQDKEEVKRIIIRLANNEVLDPKYKDHKLIGNYKDCKECHIKPDLLLIYRIDANILELALVGTGNHSELFR
jgi:mRNA interferase YafQ